MSEINTIDFFPNFCAPDLGCFVKRKHELEIGFLNIFTDYGPSIDLNVNRHQVFFRVKCGEAAFFQRAPVFMTLDASIPGQVLQNFPPDFLLGGDFTPRPSDWMKYPIQNGTRIYWFFGQYRNPSNANWIVDAKVGHTYDIYENGTLSTVYFDDTGGDDDLNDFILEVAVVDRTIPNWVALAEGQKEAMARFEQERLPHLLQQVPKLTNRKPQ